VFHPLFHEDQALFQGVYFELPSDWVNLKENTDFGWWQ
jgi:hypothetical protein